MIVVPGVLVYVTVGVLKTVLVKYWVTIFVLVTAARTFSSARCAG